MIEFLNLQKRVAPHADEIKKAVADVVDGGWYVLGTHVTGFEQDYARYIGSEYCVGVGNGLDAITLIYRAYKEMGLMQDGDEVIVPANTYIASILGITENGLTPVLVEPDIHTLLIDPELIERHITPRTRSILTVHLYGRCAYGPEMRRLCEDCQLLLVEDNAQAHGCSYEGRKTGNLGHAAAHSFYPTKNLGALGDAGAVTTDDESLAACVKSLRNYGSTRKYVFDRKGRNSRLDEMQAAVLQVRLKYLDQENEHRRRLAAFYRHHISNPLLTLPDPLPREQNVWHQYPVLCAERDRLKDFLLRQGFETQVHYPLPPHWQECYAEWGRPSLPVTEQIHATELSLPIGPEITLEEAGQVVEAINRFA